MSRKVLIVSYIFPPAGGAGVQRTLKFIKYLPKFGWEPIILTVSNSSVPLRDKSLLKDIPSDTAIHKAATLEPPYAVKQYVSSNNGSRLGSLFRSRLKRLGNALLLPDPQVLWWPGLTAAMIRIMNNHDVKCVFSSAPPFSMLVPCVFMANWFKAPVVVDFRDEWPFTRRNFENTSKSPIADKVDKLLEGYVVSHCSLFTAATQSYVDSILARHPSVKSGKGISITNGFDRDDFRSSERVAANDKIEIVYTGTVWKATSLEKFSTALLNIAMQRPELVKRLGLKLIGRVVESELQPMEALKRYVDVETAGYLPHDTIINAITNADILLLTLGNLAGSEKIIPGKTFEYMATGNHILAIVPEGETRSILENNYTAMTFANPDSVEDIQAKLEHLLLSIKSKPRGTCPELAQLSREALTRRLADVFDKAVAGGL